MTYAIVEICGKQFRVETGRFYDLDRFGLDPEDSLIMDKVLFLHDEDQILIGQPYIEGATVEGKIMLHRRARKVIVYKMQPKKKTRKKRGHRQDLTRVMIHSINLNGSVLSKYEEPEYENDTIEAEVSV